MGLCLSTGGYTSHVTDLWIWDAAYGQWDAFASWAASNRSKNLHIRSIFTDHLANSNIRLMSLFSLSKLPYVTLYEDDLVSTATSADKNKFLYPEAKAGSDQLDVILRNEPVIFMHTTLKHDKVMDERNYFERFCRETPSLRPVK